MASRTVSITELRTLLAGEGHEPLTEMAVSKFVRDGMPKLERGKYDRDACTAWYLGRLRTSVKRKETEDEDGQTTSLDKVQTRLISAKADNEEMTAAERRAMLIPLDVYESEQAKLVGVIKMQFLNLPSRIAPKLDGLSRTEAKALLTAAVKDVLAKLARKGSDDVYASDAAAPAPSAKHTRARAARKPKSRKR